MSTIQGTTEDQIAKLRKTFAASLSGKVAQNVVAHSTFPDCTLNREVLQNTDHTFDVQLDDWAVTNQKSSGRCWLFALLNMLRVGTMEKMKVKQFEFSQNWLFFWDKFNRSDAFMTAMIQESDKDVGDRTVSFMLNDPISDGGQWDMAINLIRKHGLVPKYAYPESVSSSASRFMNARLKELLRVSACEIRSAESDADRAAIKDSRMADVWRLLCIHLGTPPEEFDLQYVDKDKNLVKRGKTTPADFAKEFVTVDYEDYVCLVNDPRNPYYKCYTVKYLQNVVGAKPVRYLNIPVEEMKQITHRMLKDKLPVWFGCDVGKDFYRKGGVWDLDIYQDQALYGMTYGMGKADRLRHCQTLMTHAMLFTGVDENDSGEPRRWRVENSWGDSGGQKGFYVMNDNWFAEHMFEIAAPSKYLSDAMREALASPDTVCLPAWDPMGSLA